MDAFFWALIAAGLWGVVPLLEKAGLARTEPMAGLFYRCAGVVIGIIMLSIFILKPSQIRSVDIRSAILLMLGGFIASFIAQMAFYHGLKVGEVSKLVIVSGSYPVITFILGILIFGETVTPVKLLGAALVMAGLWIIRMG